MHNDDYKQCMYILTLHISTIKAYAVRECITSNKHFNLWPAS